MATWRLRRMIGNLRTVKDRDVVGTLRDLTQQNGLNLEDVQELSRSLEIALTRVSLQVPRSGMRYCRLCARLAREDRVFVERQSAVCEDCLEQFADLHALE